VPILLLVDATRGFNMPKVVLYGVGTVIGAGGLVALVGATMAWRLRDSLRRNGA
jgi:hypothetical protein